MKRISLFLALMILYNTSYAYRIVWGRNITISQPVYEDLYIAGGTITINAPVYGDLIVAGGNIQLNDTVTNDLLLAGGTVTISGYVADDIRCAGGELHISKNIGGDLVVSGGNVEIGRQVWIYGGLMAAGGEVVINGTINGNVKTTGGTINFNGIANKDFDCRSEKLVMNGTVNGTSVLAARNIQIGDNALFNGNVRYWNKNGHLDFKQSIRNGKASFDNSLNIKGHNWYYLNHSTLLGLLWYLGTVLLFIIIIQYLFSNSLKKAGDNISHSIWKSLGLGFLFFIGVPLLVVLLIITVIGIPLGLILMFSYAGLVVLATLIASLVVANWYNAKFECHWKFWQIVFSSLATFILFKMISFAPFLGWLVMIVIACTAFGAILRNINWRKHKIAAG